MHLVLSHTKRYTTMAFAYVLKSLAPYHLLAYSALFGTTCYQSFYAGITSYRALPLEMFSRLQSKMFPGYFLIQSVLSGILLATPPFEQTKAGWISLVIIAVTSLINRFYIYPHTAVITEKRHEQCRIENKGWKDPDVSETMKSLNKAFGKLHGQSMVLNFSGLIALIVYGVYLTARLQE